MNSRNACAAPVILVSQSTEALRSLTGQRAVFGHGNDAILRAADGAEQAVALPKDRDAALLAAIAAVPQKTRAKVATASAANLAVLGPDFIDQGLHRIN